MKSYNLGKKLKSCEIERQVEDRYNEGISFYFPKSEITYPYECDGYIEVKLENEKMLKMIMEYKFDEDMKQKSIIAKILIQVIYYLKKFESERVFKA